MYVAFVRAEDEQLVPNHRAADAPSDLVLVEARLVGAGRVGIAQRVTADLGEVVALDGVLVDEIREQVTLPPVRSRFGGGRDDRARRLLVFGLVLLRDDAELLDRILRERVALARILAGHAADEHVVLEAHPVDEDVDVVRALGPAGDAAAVAPNARCQRRQGKEVAVGQGSALDLLLRDVRGYLG